MPVALHGLNGELWGLHGAWHRLHGAWPRMRGELWGLHGLNGALWGLYGLNGALDVRLLHALHKRACMVLHLFWRPCPEQFH